MKLAGFVKRLSKHSTALLLIRLRLVSIGGRLVLTVSHPTTSSSSSKWGLLEGFDKNLLCAVCFGACLKNI